MQISFVIYFDMCAYGFYLFMFFAASAAALLTLLVQVHTLLRSWIERKFPTTVTHLAGSIEMHFFIVDVIWVWRLAYFLRFSLDLCAVDVTGFVYQPNRAQRKLYTRKSFLIITNITHGQRMSESVCACVCVYACVALQFVRFTSCFRSVTMSPSLKISIFIFQWQFAWPALETHTHTYTRIHANVYGKSTRCQFDWIRCRWRIEKAPNECMPMLVTKHTHTTWAQSMSSIQLSCQNETWKEKSSSESACVRRHTCVANSTQIIHTNAVFTNRCRLRIIFSF